MVADLPEVAQRYFARAIDPGTPLHCGVRLQMEGSFIMNGNAMPMTARQILAPHCQGFVRQAEVGSRLMQFAGTAAPTLSRLSTAAAERWCGCSGVWGCCPRASGRNSFCPPPPRARALRRQTIFVLDLAFAVPLPRLAAMLLWRGQGGVIHASWPAPRFMPGHWTSGSTSPVSILAA